MAQATAWDDALFGAFHTVLCDALKDYEQYIPDMVLKRNILDQFLRTPSLLPKKNDPKRQQALKSIRVNKEKNGAWEVSLNHSFFQHRSVYVGFEAIAPDSYDEEGQQSMLSLIQKCPAQVRELVAKERAVIARARGRHTDDEKDGQNGSDEPLCTVCKRPDRWTMPFRRHICECKLFFECSNKRCRASWSTTRGFLDPKTHQTPKDGESYCQRCRGKGMVIDWKFTWVSNATSEHKRELCGACRKWGNCRAPFVQPATIFRAFTEVYNWKPKVVMIDPRKVDHHAHDDDWDYDYGLWQDYEGVYCRVSFHDDEGVQQWLFINPYIKIL